MESVTVNGLKPDGVQEEVEDQEEGDATYWFTFIYTLYNQKRRERGAKKWKKKKKKSLNSVFQLLRIDPIYPRPICYLDLEMTLTTLRKCSASQVILKIPSLLRSPSSSAAISSSATMQGSFKSFTFTTNFSVDDPLPTSTGTCPFGVLPPEEEEESSSANLR